MKQNNLFFSLLIAVIFFIASCANQQQNSSKDSEFKQVCQTAGYEWMLMKPTKDGKRIKEAESCWGCMVENVEHVCNMEKFSEMMGSTMKNMGSETHSMQHMAMTAHAGNRNSVDVHMYKVGFVMPDIQPEKDALLKFTINDINSKKPVTDLEIVHDKTMHVILARNDLKHFNHIHPEMTEPGVFTVPYKFSSSGIYRIWIDFTIDGMQHIVDFDVNVAGNLETEEKDGLDGIKVNFSPPKEILAGKEVELKFEIFDSNKKQIPITEKFLAADAHLIAIDETLEEFGHNHDEKFDKDNKISFVHIFSKSGRYKLWLQFSKDGKEKTASFDVTVK